MPGFNDKADDVEMYAMFAMSGLLSSGRQMAPEALAEQAFAIGKAMQRRAYKERLAESESKTADA